MDIRGTDEHKAGTPGRIEEGRKTIMMTLAELVEVMPANQEIEVQKNDTGEQLYKDLVAYLPAEFMERQVYSVWTTIFTDGTGHLTILVYDAEN